MSLESPLKRWLEGLGAQRDIVEFFAPYGSDFAQAYRDLPRGDWVLALASRLVDDRGALVRAAAAVARVAEAELDRERADSAKSTEAVASGKSDALKLIEAAEDWAGLHRNGQAIVERADELEEQAEREDDGDDGDPAVKASLLAACAAARSIADPESAPLAAAHVMEALLAMPSQSESDAMERVMEIHALTAKAAKIHLPPELMRTPFKAH